MPKHGSIEEELRHSLSQLPIDILLPLVAEFKPETAPGVQALASKGLDESLVISILCEQNTPSSEQLIHPPGLLACEEERRTPLDRRPSLETEQCGVQSRGVEEGSEACTAASHMPCYHPPTQIRERNHESVVPQTSSVSAQRQRNCGETRSPVESLPLSSEAPASGMHFSMTAATIRSPPRDTEKQKISNITGDHPPATPLSLIADRQKGLTTSITGFAPKSLGDGSTQEDPVGSELQKRRTIQASPYRISRGCQTQLNAQQLNKVMLLVKCCVKNRQHIKSGFRNQAPITRELHGKGRPKGKDLATKAKACGTARANRSTKPELRVDGVHTTDAKMYAASTRHYEDNVARVKVPVDKRPWATNGPRQNISCEVYKSKSVKQSTGGLATAQSKSEVNNQTRHNTTGTEAMAPSCTSIHYRGKRKNYSATTPPVKRARTTEPFNTGRKQALQQVWLPF
ncbi:conserved hypothetical protein [Neospora caninum Liverpool]|uniref:Uncharacterized protein n=1 Tax=Neospora caninum (strain Liverpool) TaxID=572307 RepID=F0VFA1_NEOCL|nr:conserved hypothetical protein [Neospora caninum Liverpool]CBZ52395.1 conserved hypothetical protein [Neospora caninum Liverpool]CEL66366.1 TPA: hypothetical protein BN1204_021840 [Neospora caninum Liverpool]|eukprot:XP_003882427.1 conserved hypothetical protein [Neospora caninum Liverpool]